MNDVQQNEDNFINNNITRRSTDHISLNCPTSTCDTGYQCDSDTDHLVIQTKVSDPHRTRKIWAAILFVLVGLALALSLYFGLRSHEVDLPECEIISGLENGAVICSGTSHNSTVQGICHFECNDGYQINGEEQITCQNNGSWSAKAPTCNLRKCQPPPSIDHGMLKCSDENYTVGSFCTVECINNHVAQNETFSRIVCQSNEEWSQGLPVCVCHSCKIGDNCEYTTSWKVFKSRLSSYPNPLNYAGHSMNCHRDDYMIGFKRKWKCECHDSGVSIWCRKYLSKVGATEHAAAELIRVLVQQGDYPEPCDSASMPTGCL